MMKRISVLDCTLRDGGYCNKWNFGRENISKVINSTIESGIDIVECGFITSKTICGNDVTKYNSFKEIDKILIKHPDDKLMVAMVNYGEFDIEEIPLCNNTLLDGIRVAFHKKDMESALAYCKMIQDKGYKVFLQGMVSLSYSDKEFIDFIHNANELKPYAFYIVDSFGSMKKKELMRLFYLIENNLDEEIVVGFHSHNNTQLAYSNAQSLIETPSLRKLIIDSSVYGMGRGAGNLNTELFVEYLNDTQGANYDIKPLLNIIDEVLSQFYESNYWGYSLPNYLSAKHGIHPNYAMHLSEKKTLTVEAMDEIFSMIDNDKGAQYDPEYIDRLYFEYMSSGREQSENERILRELLGVSKVLIIGPGKSAVEEQDNLEAFIKNNNPLIISINYEHPDIESDYIFVSNLRRFREIDESKYSRVIATSNIKNHSVYAVIEYGRLVNNNNDVADNAGLMLIKYLILCGVDKVYISGIDGYSYDYSSNYGISSMRYVAKQESIDILNEGMKKVLEEFFCSIKLEFVTSSRFSVLSIGV